MHKSNHVLDFVTLMIVVNRIFGKITLFWNSLTVCFLCTCVPVDLFPVFILRLTNFIVMSFISFLYSVEDGDALDPSILSTLRKLQDGYFGGARSVATRA